MADDDKKATRAELAEAVRELREEVAALRAERNAHICPGHACHGLSGHAHCNWGHCHCWAWHSTVYTVPGAPAYPTVTYWTNVPGGSGTLTGNIADLVKTSVAAGVSTAVTLGAP